MEESANILSRHREGIRQSIILLFYALTLSQERMLEILYFPHACFTDPKVLVRMLDDITTAPFENKE